MNLAIINRIKDLQPDLKVEFIISELLETDLKHDDILVSPLSLFKRKYSRDIHQTEEIELLGSNRKFINLKINRNGIYDTLPEGLFHQPRSRKPNKNLRETIEEIKVQDEMEKTSRLFFLPFEQELFKIRVLIEGEERKSIIDGKNVLINEALIAFWNLPDTLEDQQLCNLLYLLPFSCQIAGNPELTQLCFESILNDKVALIDVNPLTHMVEEAEIMKLHNTFLGVDSILGSYYQETIPAIEIKVIAAKEGITDYITGSKKLLLDFLFKFFLPIENDIITKVEVHETSFLLSQSDSEGRLGFTSSI